MHYNAAILNFLPEGFANVGAPIIDGSVQVNVVLPFEKQRIGVVVESGLITMALQHVTDPENLSAPLMIHINRKAARFGYPKGRSPVLATPVDSLIIARNHDGSWSPASEDAEVIDHNGFMRFLEEISYATQAKMISQSM